MTRECKTVEVPSEPVVPGDLILRAEGDDVLADSGVTEAFGLRANNSRMTGESTAQPRDVQACEPRRRVGGTDDAVTRDQPRWTWGGEGWLRC